MALISDASYILESLRKHHLHNSRHDIHSNRIIKLQEDQYLNGINAFSPYVSQQGNPSRAERRELCHNGRDSPELAIDKEITDYDGLRVKPDKATQRANPIAESKSEGRYERYDGPSSRSGKASTATIRPGDSLGTPFSSLTLDKTPRTSDESFRDPNVKLNYSKTIGKTRKGLGRFMGLRVDDNQPIPSLAGTSVKKHDSRIGSSSSATPTAHQTGIHGRLQSGLFRRSTASTMESFSNSPRLPSSAFSPPARSQGQSSDQTPTGRTLSGLPAPVNNLRQPALSRIQRPRADSAPMVVISSPGNTRVESVQIDDTPRSTRIGHDVQRRSDTARGRIASAGDDKGGDRSSLAFSPSAVQAILGDDDESAVVSDDEDNIPRPGEDPRAHAKRDQYGSILAQTMMSQASRRRPGLGGRKVSLYIGQDSKTLAEESEESDGDTDGYDAGDISTEAPESQQSNQGLSTFEMGLTKADESLLGGLDLGERMSVNTTSSYNLAKKSKSQLPKPNTQLAFEKRPIQSAGRDQPTAQTSTIHPGALSLLFHPPQVSNEGSSARSAAVSSPFSSYASVPPPHNSSVPSLTFKMYFPFSHEPFKPIEITVRKDVTVEEVIGWALFKYCESGRKPEVYAGHEKGPNKDVNPAIWRTTAGWALRIVEDDGEVDEDFPALDRDSSVAKFAFDCFAVVEANPNQIQQNAAKLPPQALAVAVPDSTAPSRPSVSRSSSRVSSVNGRTATAFPASLMSDMPANPANAFGNASANGPSGMGGVMVPLKIRVIRTNDVQHIDTITVPSEMYFADMIEVLIKKRRLQPSEPSEWALMLGDLSMVLPLDRTVESLMGSVDLAMVTKTWAETNGFATGGRNGERRGGDPSTSIFKRGSEQSKPRYGSRMDFESTYRKYKVQRKMPIGKHERILAIDGDYIHIMPTDTRAFFDSMKTSSFHVTSITACKQYSKTPSLFRITVWKDGTEKRYEFEAENAKEAAEIINSIKGLMKLYPAEKRLPVTAPSSHLHHSRLRRRKE